MLTYGLIVLAMLISGIAGWYLRGLTITYDVKKLIDMCNEIIENRLYNLDRYYYEDLNSIFIVGEDYETD